MVHGGGWCFNFDFKAVAGRSSVDKSSIHRRSFPTTAPNIISMATSSARIAVVGDTHDDWDYELDSRALRFLQVPFATLVLLLCDFGNENVDLVRSIARVDLPKAAILGNHDSWKTREFSNNFGDSHVGFKRQDYPMLKLSVVGGRPFSSGGNQLNRTKLLKARYGVSNMDGSAKRICKAASGSPVDHFLIVLAHNGPTGLGSSMNDICGRDWADSGGDHGDPDLAQAISEIKATTKRSIPLVVFGHMHKALTCGGLRKMIYIGADNTIYLNGAIVPRVRKLNGDQGKSSISISENGSSVRGTARAFTLVELVGGKVTKIAETWVLVTEGDCISLQEEHLLFESI
ncbi:hypothetical protein V2J09_004211 [Rumex salicifolius]